ncbi:MAG TPA: putative sugar nucleotidyl transferase [Arachidicoccus sp.]
MAIILYEKQAQREKFYPLTFTKPFAELHVGIFSVKKWWEKVTKQEVFVSNQEVCENDEVIYINAHLLPSEYIWDEIQNLKQGQSLKDGSGNTLAKKYFSENESLHSFISKNSFLFIEYPSQLLQYHAKIIEWQFHLIAKERTSQKISSTNKMINEENIFIEEHVEMEYAILNAKEGFVYIGANAVVMEGAAIRGAFALGENSVVKMGAKIYGATSTGRKCTIGGEIKNTIFNHCSNKAHDGYLGDSIIGSWCNFGAGATNSNVKNTASEVGVYDYHLSKFLSSGKKFGVLMGDYSRVAINSSINTGSSIGTCCNVFGNGLLPKFIPNFSWGTANKGSYEFEKAIGHINNWMALKGEKLNEQEFQTLKHIFETLES